MAAQSQAQRGVVVHDGFAFAGGGQRKRRLADRRIAQQRGHGLQRGGLPHLLAPVPGQAGQRIGGGQLIELAGIQRGAARQVIDIDKSPRGARRGDAPPRCLGQSAHHAQAQTHGGA